MLFSAYVWGRTTWHEASFVYITQVCSVSVKWRNARGVLLLKTVPRYYPCHHIRFILSSGLGNIYGNIMTSTEFRGSNAFHYTQEKRKVTCMLYYLRKAFKAGNWSVCLEGKGCATSCIRSPVFHLWTSNDTTIFGSVIAHWPIKFAKDDVVHWTKSP